MYCTVNWRRLPDLRAGNQLYQGFANMLVFRWFFVDRFKDLDTRLRSLIQKIACPAQVHQPSNSKCEVGTQRGCNRALNEICVLNNGLTRCVCPPLFERHPLTGTCGHPDCKE
jgi:hypothetical protein